MLCMFAFENALGGRVVVHAMNWDNMSAGVSFNHTFRREQLHGVMNWLSRDALPISIMEKGVYPLAFRKDCEHYSIIGLFNLSLDPWPYAEFKLYSEREPASTEVLKRNGDWERVDDITIKREGGNIRIGYGKSIPFDQPLFITVNWK